MFLDFVECLNDDRVHGWRTRSDDDPHMVHLRTWFAEPTGEKTNCSAKKGVTLGKYDIARLCTCRRSETVNLASKSSETCAEFGVKSTGPVNDETEDCDGGNDYRDEFGCHGAIRL